MARDIAAELIMNNESPSSPSGGRVEGGKPFEEPVAFDPVFV